MQLLLNIKDQSKAILLMEFLKSLNYISSIKQVEDNHIPEWHKSILNNRLKQHNDNPNEGTNWQDLEKLIDDL